MKREPAGLKAARAAMRKPEPEPKKQPTEKQKQFLQAVRDLAEAASLVNQIWDYGDEEIPADIANDEYPFEESFDEYPLRIGAWANAIQEEIEKGIPTETPKATLEAWTPENNTALVKLACGKCKGSNLLFIKDNKDGTAKYRCGDCSEINDVAVAR